MSDKELPNDRRGESSRKDSGVIAPKSAPPTMTASKSLGSTHDNSGGSLQSHDARRAYTADAQTRNRRRAGSATLLDGDEIRQEGR